MYLDGWRTYGEEIVTSSCIFSLFQWLGFCVCTDNGKDGVKLLRSGPFVTILCISDWGNFRWGKNLWSKAWWLWIVAKCITISGLSSGRPILLQISWQNCTQSTIPKVSKASAFVEAVLSTHKWQNLLEDFRTLIFDIQRSSSYMAVMQEVMPKIEFG
jgi:hypothetical protein